MPRSAPGRVTASPSSRTRPVVARSRPATMRSSVDLAAARRAQDGDEVVVRDGAGRGCSARRGLGRARAGGKVRDTPSIEELAHRPAAPRGTGVRFAP